MRFNIDKTVNIEVDLEKGRKNTVWAIYSEGGKRSMLDLLGVERYRNVTHAIEFILKEKGVESALTLCGVVVYRGHVK